jgi:hypothetical protein
MTTQLSLMANPIDEAFIQFHHANPHVYRELVSRARQIKRAGHRKYSIKTILETMRWESDLAGANDGTFKVNNNFASRYVRLVQANEPDLADFFATRTLHSDTGDWQ